MSDIGEAQGPLVRRITIDEKLEDGLFRILIASLRDNIMEFSDELWCWNEEREDFILPEDYAQKLGMTKRNAEAWPWDSLCEGQVFLQGRFMMNPNQKARMKFFVNKRRRNFRRVDPLLKEQVKQTYLAVLQRSVSDAEKDQAR